MGNNLVVLLLGLFVCVFVVVWLKLLLLLCWDRSLCPLGPTLILLYFNFARVGPEIP